MGVGKFTGKVTRGLRNQGTVSGFLLDLDYIGPVRAQANRQLCEGGLRSGYVPKVGDRVTVVGNFNGDDFINVYAIELAEAGHP